MTTLYNLQAETESALMAAADSIEAGWQTIGAIAVREREAARKAGVPVMLVYERIGQAARGASKSTIRQYAWLAEKIDGDMLIEFPMLGLDAWRRIVAHAAQNGESVTDVALSCVDGGTAITADAIAAKLRGDIDKPDKFGRAVHRLHAALASMARNARTDADKLRALALARTAEKAFPDEH
jgi:hypothetical protein